MRTLIVLTAGLLALCVSGAGAVSLVLDTGKLSLGVHAADAGMTLHIKLGW